MKRTIAMCLAVALLVIGAQVIKTLSPSSVAFACSYSSYEHQSYRNVAFYSVYLGRTDWLQAWLTTWDGDAFSGYRCGGYKQYELVQATYYGTPGNYFSQIRVWTCGSYTGSYSAGSSITWSQQLFYPIDCQRQADDAGSWFYDYYGGQYISVYLTQG